MLYTLSSTQLEPFLGYAPTFRPVYIQYYNGQQTKSEVNLRSDSVSHAIIVDGTPTELQYTV